MKKKVINGLKVISLLLAIAIMIGLMPGTISVAQAATISNGGYPYGKNMGSSEITLVCEASGGSNYQWQSASSENETFTNIASATLSEYTFTPISGTWYRCVVDGTESKAIQAIKPISDSGRTWTKPYNSGKTWYLTNGKVAYTTNGSNFDVVGEYTKDNTKYMICTSYNRSWVMYTGETASAPNKVMFSFSDVAVIINVSLGDTTGNFAFGCDTQLGNSSTSGDYSDRAALVASLNSDNTLKHISMIGASSLSAAKDDDPAFVIEPSQNPMFWIGHYSDRTVYSYNKTNNTTYNTRESVKDAQGNTVDNVVVSVEGDDSGMTMSWKGVNSVQFEFKVGTAKETGAVSGNVNYLADTIDDLEANTVYTIAVKDSNGTTTATYTIKSDANGSIPLAGKDQNGTEYDLTGKKIVISKNGSDDEPATIEIEPRPSENNEQPGTTDYAKPEDITKAETEVTKNTITIIPSTEFKKNQQYRLFNENGTEIDGQEWMSIDETGRLTFTGLTEGTTYLIRAFIPATATTPRSYISVGTAIQTISNAAAAIVTANNRTYDGTDQPLVTVNGGANGGTMYYAIGNTNGPTSEYTPSIPTATEVGTYYVWCYAKGDSSHKDSGAGCVEVAIAKAEATVTKAPAAKTLTYNEAEQELVTAGTAVGGTMQYALGTDSTTGPTSEWSIAIPKGKEAGTYYIWFKAAGDASHTDSVPACVISTITSGGIDVEIIPKEGAPKTASSNLAAIANEETTAEERNRGVKFWLSNEPLSENQVPAASKNVLTAKLQELGYTAGTWFDLSLFKQVNGFSPVAIRQTKNAVLLSIGVPEELWKEGRTFSLLAEHDGLARKLDETTGHVLNGESKLFSTYLIAYKDPEPVQPTEAPAAAPTATPTKVPRTGDGANLGLWIGLLLLGLLGIAVFTGAVKRKHRKQ